MKFSEARQGRVFVIRLEDGEIIHETIERFAGEQGIKAAALILLREEPIPAADWWWVPRMDGLGRLSRWFMS